MTEQPEPKSELPAKRPHAGDNGDSESKMYFVRRHLRFGWWSLLAFLTLGFVLEVFNAIKLGWYLEVSNEIRRTMLTLAHTHGTLLALVHLGFAALVGTVPGWHTRSRTIASGSLTAAGLMIPLGFLLGGIFIYPGDPGLGILLVPPGAFLLFVAVLLSALAVRFFSLPIR